MYRSWVCETVFCRSVVMMSLVLILAGFSPGLAGTVDFSASPREGYAPLEVRFIDQSSGFETISPTSEWLFPGGTPNHAIGAAPVVTYTESGKYDVTLLIKTGDKVVDELTRIEYIEVYSRDYDFGDAPDTPGTDGYNYFTLYSSERARHFIVEGLGLGTIVDGEHEGLASINADGDDLEGEDDEDGVTLDELVIGRSNSVTLDAFGSGYLSGWIDLNRDGDWDDSGEQIFEDVAMDDIPLATSIEIDESASPGDTYARFRFSTVTGLDYKGAAPDGEVEDYKVELVEESGLDWGDAPDDYDTLLPDGARHPVSASIYLGEQVDGEENGFPTVGATGDDADNLDDEDGVSIPALFAATTSGIDVVTQGRGYLHGWVDVDGNGQFDHPEERLIHQLLGDGEHRLPLEIPVEAAMGHNYARFRYCSDEEIGPTGLGSAGEVEDYVITIQPAPEMDFGDLPDSYSTLMSSDGAVHLIYDQIFLGTEPPDGEEDGNPTVDAQGDDILGDDDENGVEFLDPLIPGSETRIRLTLQTAERHASIWAWLDTNADGDFGDPGELLLSTLMRVAGAHPASVLFTLNIPADATPGSTYMRFRVSLLEELAPDGSGFGGAGEVEDYAVDILDSPGLDFGDAHIPGFPSLLADNGPRHPILDGLALGDRVDGEEDAQDTGIPTLGDDESGDDDEDGISPVFVSPGDSEATVELTTRCPADQTAYLHGWVDMNQNMILDPDEKVFDGISLATGTHRLSFLYPYSDVRGAVPARFRYSLDRDLDASGLGTWGEVEDHILFVGFDYGDAPDNLDTDYRTRHDNDGAYHTATERYYLGETIDVENNGISTENALGDDELVLSPGGGPDDEDGVLIPILKPGQPAVLDVTCSIHVPVVEPGLRLNGWIDFNADGDWDDPGERAINDMPVYDGLNVIGINVPASAVTGPTYARFRLNHGMIAVGHRGYGGVGEVEDYLVIIDDRSYDFGDAPDIYGTYNTSMGARHVLDPSIHLGTHLDVNTDGLPTADASGDDNNGSDDEDGVEFLSPLIPGEEARIRVQTRGSGHLYAWADFNQDGDWSDLGERIFTSTPLAEATYTINFPVPEWTPPGHVYFRFRYTRNPVMRLDGSPPLYMGTFFNGEVEDYRVTVGGDGEEIPAWKWSQTPLTSPSSYYTQSFNGWSESSVYSETLIADDWFCGDGRPVKAIRWWGSYADWQDTDAPDSAPDRFHIAIWSDSCLNEIYGPGQPQQVLWEQTVPRSTLEETCVGSSFLADSMMAPDSCFAYRYEIPEADWFYQTGDSTMFWLSIAALYDDGTPVSHAWGWTTRPRYFRTDAMRIDEPTIVAVDSVYRDGQRISSGWDMAFQLMTTDYEMTFDYGDADTSLYPTRYADNGAHHFVWPGVHLGAQLDREPDAQSNEEATRDDLEGVDDEDGVELPDSLQAGSVSFFVVNASASGLLDGWIDYNHDGDWTDAGEHVLINMPVVRGNNNMIINVPRTLTSGRTTARFRYRGSGSASSTGLIVGGEVEDYTVYLYTMTTGVEDETHASTPESFELLNNYPNPFNPSTTIAFHTPQPAEVEIKIHDVRGRLVRTLLRGEWTAGHHQVLWDGRNRTGLQVTSGVYFYTLTAKRLDQNKLLFRDVKKMLLVK